MHVNVRFDLSPGSDDEHDWEIFKRGHEFYMAISDIQDHLRECLNHGHQYKSADESLEGVQKLLGEALTGGELP